jgi:DNA polymerase II
MFIYHQLGFLLTRQSRDVAGHAQVEYWLATENGPMRLLLDGELLCFYFSARDKDRALELFRQHHIHGRLRTSLLNTFQHELVLACCFQTLAAYHRAAELLRLHQITLYESDLRFADVCLMQRFITAGMRFSGHYRQRAGYREVKLTQLESADVTPHFRVLSLDVECAMDGELYSVALLQREPDGREVTHVIMVGAAQPSEMNIEWVTDEYALLLALERWLLRHDPDIIIGWNVVNFDFRLLLRRAEIHQHPLRWGRGQSLMRWRPSRMDDQQGQLILPGRMVIDGIEALKSATFRFDRFGLEFVAQELLGRGKAIHDPDDRIAEIVRLFHHDKPALAHYNLEDCRLVIEIFDKCHLLSFLCLRSQLTGLELDRYGGSVAAFTNLYIPRLHQAGYVAPNLPQGAIATSPGGYVMNSLPGFYHDVLVLDFKSLYPSIIRTFHIDPLALVHGLQEPEDETIPGYVGGRFSRQHHILPGLIDHLWQAREQAKKEHDQPRSQAIKILMNAFYGVMGSVGCRFFDPRLASGITMRGHWIMQESRLFIESQGYTVIYGDTDSIFVWLKNRVSAEKAQHLGSDLVLKINQWWKDKIQTEFQLKSCLELQFERHYHRFLMPTLRGTELGSKKRYAGLCRVNGQDKLIFKGMETVRSDWTELAKIFQTGLYERIFQEQDPRDFIREMIDKTLRGELDECLVYRKRLRRKLNDYDKTQPPHVKAARLADQIRQKRGLAPRYQHRGWIEYVITTQGAEPVAYQQHPLDYQHYIDKQLKPVADAILPHIHLQFDQIVNTQLSLF